MYLSLFISLSIIHLTTLSVLGSTVTVQKGETLSKIAKENNITLRELMDSNQIFDANKLKEGQVLTLPSNAKRSVNLTDSFHIVKKGDSLNKISERYNVNKTDIIKINNLKNPNKLYTGQKISLPKTSIIKKDSVTLYENNFHIISKGETLTSISNLYKIPVQKLMKINRLQSPNSIPLGTKIMLNYRSKEDLEKVNIIEEANSDSPKLKNKKIIDPTKENIVQAKEYKKQDQLYEWRGYGPLKINWTSWKHYEGNYVASSIHKSGKPLFIAIRCKERRINRTGETGQWRKWIAPRDTFEHNLINDLCQDDSIILSEI